MFGFVTCAGHRPLDPEPETLNAEPRGQGTSNIQLQTIAKGIRQLHLELLKQFFLEESGFRTLNPGSRGSGQGFRRAI